MVCTVHVLPCTNFTRGIYSIGGKCVYYEYVEWPPAVDTGLYPEDKLASTLRVWGH